MVFCTRCGVPIAANSQFCSQCGSAATDPATAPSLISSASYPVAAGPGYGGFWIRLVAVIIDAILVELIVLPLGFFIGAAIGLAGVAVGMPNQGTRLVGLIVGFGLGVFANWLYEAGLESSSRQATVGKMAMGLKVTDLSGQRISFARATGRHFAKFLSGMILMIGYIMAGLTARKQALHDMVAGTLVQRV